MQFFIIPNFNYASKQINISVVASLATTNKKNLDNHKIFGMLSYKLSRPRIRY